MLVRIALCLFGSISLIVVDHLLGNGFMNFLRTKSCNMADYVRHSLGDVADFVRHFLYDAEKRAQNSAIINDVMTSYFILSEILLISLIFLLIKKGKNLRDNNRLDELLQESKDTLKITDDFLEKWRKRRIPLHNSYINEELQASHPIELEVPILRMAIVDARVRSQPERGDAGDTLEWISSNVLSTVSLVEDELDSDVTDQTSVETRPWCRQQKYLWDVIEEDASMEY